MALVEESESAEEEDEESEPEMEAERPGGQGLARRDLGEATPARSYLRLRH